MSSVFFCHSHDVKYTRESLVKTKMKRW